MPVTPQFKLSQDDSFVILEVHLPHIRTTSLEHFVDEYDVSIFCHPYLLKLALPGRVMDDEETKAIYDPSNNNGTVTLYLHKVQKGEHFPDLDMVTKLLQPKPKLPSRSRFADQFNTQSVVDPVADATQQLESLCIDHERKFTEYQRRRDGNAPLIEVINSHDFEQESSSIEATHSTVETSEHDRTSTLENSAMNKTMECETMGSSSTCRQSSMTSNKDTHESNNHSKDTTTNHATTLDVGKDTNTIQPNQTRDTSLINLEKTISTTNETEISELIDSTVKYGFNNSYSNIFGPFGDESILIVDLMDPDSTPPSKRTMNRLLDEIRSFDKERCITDWIQGDEDPIYIEAMEYKAPWELFLERVTHGQKESLTLNDRYKSTNNNMETSELDTTTLVDTGKKSNELDAAATLVDTGKKSNELDAAATLVDTGKKSNELDAAATLVDTGKESNELDTAKEENEASAQEPNDVSAQKISAISAQNTGDLNDSRAETKKQQKNDVLATKEQDIFGEFTEEEKILMRQLPNKEYLIDTNSEEECHMLCTLLTILYGYCYDMRMTQGEHNVESTWEILKLSPSLSWLDTSFKTPYDALAACTRRAMLYTYIRRWDIASRVADDTAKLFLCGRRMILRALLDIHSLISHEEHKYLLNKIFLTDFCVWIQKIDASSLQKFASAMQKAAEQLQQDDTGFPLSILEQEAAHVVLEHKSMEEAVQAIDAHILEASKMFTQQNQKPQTKIEVIESDQMNSEDESSDSSQTSETDDSSSVESSDTDGSSSIESTLSKENCT